MKVGIRYLLLPAIWLVFVRAFAQVAGPTYPSVQADSLMNLYFTRDSGWNGGDGAYSLLLPDDRILWWFGDSFFGTVGPGRNRDGNRNTMVRNAFLVQENLYSPNFRALNPGYLKNTQSLLKYKDCDESERWYWPLGATVCGNQVHMVLMRMKKVGEGMWGFASEAVDLAVFSLPELRLTAMAYDKCPGDVSYGSAILENDDGYTYLYGSSRSGLLTHLHVARVHGNNLTADWEFLDVDGWQSAPSRYAIHGQVSSMFSVWKEQGRYLLLTQEANLGRKLFLFETTSPVGPFVNERVVYEIPEAHGAGGMLSYNAIVHPEFSRTDSWMVSYSINPSNFWDNFSKPGSADKYRPVFIRLRKDE